jgi:hypothetical protein
VAQQRLGRKNRPNRAEKSDPNHCSIEHLNGNARVTGATPRDEEIRQAKKRVEEEISDWLSDSLISRDKAQEVWTTVTDLATDEFTREEAEAAYREIRSAVLRRYPSQEARAVRGGRG